MRRAIWICLVLTGSATANADDASVDPRPAIAPTLSISGDLKGQGKVAIGLDGLIPLGDHSTELRVGAAFTAASTDGLATVFTSSNDGFAGASSWQGELGVTYSILQAAPGPTAADLESTAFRRRLVLRCLAAAKDPIALVNDWRRRALAPTGPDFALDDKLVQLIDPLEYCPESVEEFAEAANGKNLPLPRHQLSFAFRIGRTATAQLSPTEDAMTFEKTTKRNPSFAAGATYAGFVPDHRLTFEIPADITSSYESGGTKARWCVPAGQVTRPDGSGADAAESCNELPVGDPVRTTAIHGAAYFGFVGKDYDWRVAVGPTATYHISTGTNPFEVGLEAPFYLVRSSSKFSGIVRATPSVLVTRDANGKVNSEVMLTIALLADRTLFATALH